MIVAGSFTKGKVFDLCFLKRSVSLASAKNRSSSHSLTFTKLYYKESPFKKQEIEAFSAFY